MFDFIKHRGDMPKTVAYSRKANPFGSPPSMHHVCLGPSVQASLLVKLRCACAVLGSQQPHHIQLWSFPLVFHLSVGPVLLKMVVFQLFLLSFFVSANMPPICHTERGFIFLITDIHKCKQIVHSQALGFVILSDIQAFKNLGLKGIKFENVVDSGPSLYEPNSNISIFNL